MLVLALSGSWLTVKGRMSAVTSSKSGVEREKRKKKLAGWIFVSAKGVPPLGHRYNWPEVWGSPFLFYSGN